MELGHQTPLNFPPPRTLKAELAYEGNWEIGKLCRPGDSRDLAVPENTLSRDGARRSQVWEADLFASDKNSGLGGRPVCRGQG